MSQSRALSRPTVARITSAYPMQIRLRHTHFIHMPQMAGPHLYPPPPEIVGIPTRAELDALPRRNTWESLKDTIGNESLHP